MPWQNQGGGGPWGGGGGGGGPWGGGNGGGGQRGPGGPGGFGGQPPNIEELIRRWQDWLRRRTPGGFGGKAGIIIVVVAVIGLWIASGFYRVLPDEQGVVLRFGERVRVEGNGLNYHLPYPIETVIKPKVTRVNRVEIGFSGGTQILDESLMLTGDENIVDINFVVLWLIKDAGDFLFNVRRPEETVKAAAETVMREIVGQTPIAAALAEGRGEIEDKVRSGIQRILDDYRTGVTITEVQLLKADPPGEVVDAFRDVQRARADQERLRNEAEGYANDIIPKARGEAERLIQEAEAYKQEVVARAEGDADRFHQVYVAYRAAKDVTTQRIYLETMEEILANANKILIDQDQAGTGVVPYLPLPEVEKRRLNERETEQ